MPQNAAQLATYAPAPAPEHYVWWFPGCPVKVHLELGVAQKLKNRVEQARGAIEHGLLFGKAWNGTTEILDFDPLTGGDAAEAVAALPEHRQRALVGYYRTDPGETLRLKSTDLVLAESHFAQPHHVFLLIQLGAFGAPNASFFFHRNDRSMADFPFLEFPLDADMLAREERGRLNRSRAAGAVELPPVALPQPEPLALVRAVSTPPPDSVPVARRRRTFRKAVACVAAGGLLGAAAVGLRNRSARERAGHVWSAITNPSVPAAVPSPAPRPSQGFGLVAQRQAGDVQLSWNRESAAIAAAISGVLAIEDGGALRQIPLSSSQVHSGSVLYSPASAEVSMQLTVATPGGEVSESVMVVFPSAGPPVKTYPLEPAPGSSPSQDTQPAALVVKASKPFAGVPVIMSAPPDTAPTLTDAPPVALKPAPASISIPAVAPPQAPAARPVQATMPQTSPPAAPTAAPPPAPQRRVAAPNYIPPRPMTKAEPKIPVELRTSVTKPHMVEVRVSIDQHGRVTRAQAVPQPGISEFFVEATVNAARLWRFEPARRDNQPVPSEMTLQFILDR